EGVAVTWVFSKPLATTGSFVVEAELSGLKYAGQTEGGLHFTDETGTARVRVGKVTAVDSTQNRWDVPVPADRDRLRIEVPAEILAAATYPLAIDPRISPEVGIDNPVITPASSGVSA